MEFKCPHPLLQYTEEEMVQNRKEYCMSNVQQLNTDIDSIVDWFNKQPHLVGAGIERETIERMMLQAKGSIEKTKSRIERLYTLKAASLEIFGDRDTHNTDLDNTWKWCRTVVMPKLFNGQRVTLMHFTNDDSNVFEFLNLFRVGFMMGDLRLRYDYSIGDIYVLDLANTSISHLTKVNPYVMRKAESLYQEGYGTRIVGIHILNAPSYADKLLYLVKQTIKPKITSRIMLHSSLDDLHQHVPREYLPSDYGGLERSMEELGEIWRTDLRSADRRRFFLDSQRLVADESQRVGGRGAPDTQLAGSFRKLELD